MRNLLKRDKVKKLKDNKELMEGLRLTFVTFSTPSGKAWLKAATEKYLYSSPFDPDERVTLKNIGIVEFIQGIKSDIHNFKVLNNIVISDEVEDIEVPEVEAPDVGPGANPMKGDKG